MSNHCLVCGQQQSGKKYLLNKLINNIDINHINDNRSQCIWNIVNKYYSSDITLTIVNSTKSISSTTTNDTNDESKTSSNSNIDPTEFQAVILVINLSQPQSMVEKELNEWFNVLSPYLSGSDCSLLLGNYVKPYSITDNINQHKQKEFHQYLHNWSVDNCFEFVPSPHSPPITDTDDNKHNDHNFYGPNSPLFASYDVMELGHSRISSALQCVMWPNMSRNPPKPRNKLIHKPAIQPLLANVSEEKVKEPEQKHINEQQDISKPDAIQSEQDLFRKHDKVKLIGLQSKQHWNGQIAEIVGSFSKTKKRWPVELMYENEKKKALIQTKNLLLERKGPRWNIKQKKDTEDKVDQDEEKVNEDNNDTNDGDGDNEQENSVEVKDKSLEAKMNGFQALIDEMQRVRSDAKSGKLSDDERRKRAADTAMKLASFMGLDDVTQEALVGDE